MPRVGRVILPNYPHHVVQRGHNRQVVFVENEDYERYLADLRELKDAFGVKVYAYCLMTNHVHLPLAPDESVTGLSQLMKTLSARMTRYRNRLEHRSGTLWESRFKSSLVQSDAYLLACSRYIELSPVRARLVRRAAEYIPSTLGVPTCGSIAIHAMERLPSLKMSAMTAIVLFLVSLVVMKKINSSAMRCRGAS